MRISRTPIRIAPDARPPDTARDGRTHAAPAVDSGTADPADDINDSVDDDLSLMDSTRAVSIWTSLGFAALVVLVLLIGIGLVVAAGSSGRFGSWFGFPATPSPAEPAMPSPAQPAGAGQPITAARTLVPAGSIPTRAFALWKSISLDLFADPLDPVRSFQPARVIPPAFDILDGATLKSDDLRIRLAGIAPLHATAVCLSDQSTKFACGLMARASLANLATAGRLVCFPDVSIDSDHPQFLCNGRGRDLALAQVEAGFALPAVDDVPAMTALASSAKARHAGAWNGGWTIIPPQGSGQ